MAGGSKGADETDDRVTLDAGDDGRRGDPMQEPAIFRDIVAAMPDGVYVVDSGGLLLYANPAFCRTVGFDSQELIGLRPPFPFWPGSEATDGERGFPDMMQGARSPVETTLRRKSGELFTADIQTSVVFGADGRPSALVATVRDVSDRTKMEGTLRQSEERWRSIAENPYDFVVIIGPDYKYTYVNHTAPGLRSEDLIGKAGPFDFVAPAFHEVMRDAFEKVFRTGQATTYDLYVEMLGRWFSSVVGPIKTNGVVTALSILTRDVTDVKTAELAVRTSEHRLKLATAGGDVGVFDIDLETGESFYSSRLTEMLGYDVDLTWSTEKRLAVFAEHLHAEDREATVAALQVAMAGGEPFDRDYRLARPGHAHRWVHGRARRLPGPGGTMHFSGFVSDITARKDAERERAALEAQLRQLQKLDTLGRLAAGLAHDFNNLLVPILGNAELLLGEVGLDSPLRSGLLDIVQAAGRAREIAGRILVFGRHSDEPLRRTRVPDIVREAVRFLRASAPRQIEIVENIRDDCPEILAIPGQIHQAITNLFTNAYQALKDRPGRISVEVAAVTIDPALAQRHQMTGGEALRVVVADDGPGMPTEVLERAFEPFFTTKAPGEGSGLGLSLVHGIVTQHQGAIVAESSPGRGARFELYFPLHLRAPETTPGAPIDSSPPLSAIKRRILCVDDDATVLRVISRVFGRAGHVVTAVPSSREALERVRAKPVDFDVVVTDQTMPRLTGLELANALYDVRRDLPVILLSGFADPGLTDGAPPNVRICLQKPLTARALLQAVERASE